MYLCKRRKKSVTGLRRWISSSARRQEGSAVEAEAVDLQKALEQLGGRGIQNDSDGYSQLVRLCAEQGSLADGKLVHDHIVRSGYAADTYLGNLVVDMYGKCGDLAAARAAFDAIREKNCFSWAILLTACNRSSHCRAVLNLVQQMDLEGVRAERIVSLALIDASSRLFDLKKAKQVHLRTLESGWCGNLAVANALVSMYGKCGDLQAARLVFDSLQEKTVVSWNAGIGAYARNGDGKEALQLLKLMDLEGVKPDRITFLSIVDACTSLGNLAESKLAYARVVASGLDSDVSVGTSLVNMYGRSSSLADAKAAFDSMQQKNVVTWNVMMAAYNQNGQPQKALELFHAMEGDLVPDKITFINALDACVSLKFLADGRDVHTKIASRGMDSELVMGNALINMYSKCASPADARSVFDRMVVKDAISWNTMIATYARNGYGKEGIEVFNEMGFMGIAPDKYTLISVLDACCGLASPKEGREKGKEIYERVESMGYLLDVALVTALIKMFGKFGMVPEARRLFDGMKRRVALTWARMITAYVQNGNGVEAIELYKQMDVEPDKVTFASVLSACSSVQALEEGKQIHSRIVDGKFEKDIVVDNTLLDLYGQCGCLKEARDLFDSMQDRDVISWNGIIRAYLFNDRPREALRLFYEMEEEGGVKRDRVSYVSALDACASMGRDGLVHGKTLHSMIISNKVHVEVFVGTALVTMYGRCGSVKDARVVFDDMRCKNTVTWTAMIGAYADNDFSREALELFRKMDQEGCRVDKITYITALDACKNLEDLATGKKLHNRVLDLGFCSDPVVLTGLVGMYGKCGHLQTARRLFEEISLSQRCVIAWNAMISAYVKGGEKSEVFRLLEEMNTREVKPDRATFLTILNGVAGLTAPEFKLLHESARSNGLETDSLVGTALLNLLTRFGKLNEARQLFDKLNERDTVSWTSMIVAYAAHGVSQESVDLFKQMQLQGIQPDDISFLGVLSACNHAGMFRQGWEYFVSMVGDFGVEALADHYCCMVDLLGRAGKLAEAEDLICNMPYKPDEATWTALVGACNIHGDAQVAARIARAMEGEDQVVAPHVLICNTLRCSSE